MLKIIGRELNNIVKVNDEVNNLLLIRFTIIKETPNHLFVGTVITESIN
jgi:hypothetical protein